jgi:hypothetical protein
VILEFLDAEDWKIIRTSATLGLATITDCFTDRNPERSSVHPPSTAGTTGWHGQHPANFAVALESPPPAPLEPGTRA